MIQKFGSGGVVSVLIAAALGMAAFNAATTPPVPNFLTHQKPPSQMIWPHALDVESVHCQTGHMQSGSAYGSRPCTLG